MTPEERQELRDWSARDLMGWKSSEPFGMEWIGEGLDPLLGILKDEWAPDLPASPASQILGVIEKMRELGWEMITEYDKNRCWVRFFKRVNGGFGESFEDNPLDAILLAARKAVEGR